MGGGELHSSYNRSGTEITRSWVFLSENGYSKGNVSNSTAVGVWLHQGLVAMKRQALLWLTTDDGTQLAIGAQRFDFVIVIAIGVAQANVCNLESGESFSSR
mmetsp:Transcript_40901/g.60585  ORF Transcript_40901/g.60585 Transcript_40901/m.60585 type:complete len:102 (-) Transcript_40901:2325-2630(-)